MYVCTSMWMLYIYKWLSTDCIAMPNLFEDLIAATRRLHIYISKCMCMSVFILDIYN